MSNVDVYLGHGLYGGRAELEDLLRNNLSMSSMLLNLENFSKAGVFDDCENVNLVLSRLHDADYLERSRVHPIDILDAANTYASGRSLAPSSEWVPNADIVMALNEAFCKAVKNVEPTNKRYMFGIDVSGAMGTFTTPLPLSPSKVAAAMAMIAVETEPFCFVGGFQDEFVPLNELFVKGANLQDIMRETYATPSGRTDVASIVRYALENDIVVDTFIVYTDNKHVRVTNEAATLLEEYCQKTNTDAKLIIVKLATDDFFVTNRQDLRQVFICGFNSLTPAIISKFSCE